MSPGNSFIFGSKGHEAHSDCCFFRRVQLLFLTYLLTKKQCRGVGFYSVAARMTDYNPEYIPNHFQSLISAFLVHNLPNFKIL